MLNYDQAIAQILDMVIPNAAQEVPLPDALGLVLSENVISEVSLPPFANSAMDGFAVRADDVEYVPVTLPISGEIPAGASACQALAPATAMRIMTGAPLPHGADTVIPVEDTEAEQGEVSIHAMETPGQCVRAKGDDVMEGDVVVTADSLIRPAEIGMLAAVGRPSVRGLPPSPCRHHQHGG